MNRSYPPYRGSQGQSGPQNNPQNQPHEGFYAPAHVLMGLIRQSENRYMTYRDLAMKQDQGFGRLQIDAQNMSIALARDPAGLDQLSESLRSALAAAQMNKYLLEQACNAELYLQGELKRWLNGQPPLGRPPAVFQPRLAVPGGGAGGGGPQSGPPGQHVFGPVPQGWYPTPQGQGPQQQQQQQSQQQQQQSLQQPPQGYFPQQQPPQGYAPQAPQGYVPPQPAQPVDLRDPAAAAEFLKRAQPMPLGAPGQPAGYSPAPAPVVEAAAQAVPAPQQTAPASPAAAASHAPANGAVQKGA